MPRHPVSGGSALLALGWRRPACGTAGRGAGATEPGLKAEDLEGTMGDFLEESHPAPWPEDSYLPTEVSSLLQLGRKREEVGNLLLLSLTLTFFE